MSSINQYLNFIKEAGKLKEVERTAWSENGRRESTAEHSWRLALFSFLLADDMEQIDREKVVMMSLLHDMGELYGGDISAALHPDKESKYKEEYNTICTVFSLLPEKAKKRFTALWEEYEEGTTCEAKLVKALDKAETIIQHNQGKNPTDFDYAFNLEYGSSYFTENNILKEIREQIDSDTKKHLF